jgi:hypothetical protein
MDLLKTLKEKWLYNRPFFHRFFGVNIYKIVTLALELAVGVYQPNHVRPGVIFNNEQNRNRFDKSFWAVIYKLNFKS